MPVTLHPSTTQTLPFLREGTAADWGVIHRGRFFGVHHTYDGYPQRLGADLAGQAGAMASSPEQWDQVAMSMDTKQWVEMSDVITAFGPDSGPTRPAVPSHPDGDHEDSPLNLAYLVPRRPRAEVAAFLSALDPDLAEAIMSSHPEPIIPEPSWAELSAMPVATKTNRPFGDTPSPWAYTADLDNDEFVIYDARSGTNPGSLGKAYATVGLNDEASLTDLSDQLHEAIDVREPPRLSRSYRRQPAYAGKIVVDGMWNRPPDYPPLTGDPRQPIPMDAGDGSRATELLSGSDWCLEPTSRGSLCHQQKPSAVGISCAAGHPRKR